MLAAEFCLPQLLYFNTGENLGGAGGFMCGIEAAVEMGYEYVWIMDDDAYPSRSALANLLNAGRLLPNWGFLSSAVYWTDGTLCVANRPKRTLFRHIGKIGSDNKPTPIVMGSFVSMLIPSSVVKHVGLPIAEYFIWSDDYEYSGRISKMYSGYFVPKSTVVHAMTDNSRADIVRAKTDRLERFRLLYRNDWNCYRQFGLRGKAYLASKVIYTTADIILNAQEKRMHKLRTLLDGCLDGVRFNPRIRKCGDAVYADQANLASTRL